MRAFGFVRSAAVLFALAASVPAQFFLIQVPMLWSWQIDAPSAAVIDGDSGALLWGKAAHTRRANASTTKMVTALVARDFTKLPPGHPARRSLYSTITVGWAPPLTGGSSANLQYGEQLSFYNALRFLLMRSGNDAAVAIAEHCAFSEGNFVPLMNNKVLQLGLSNTNFVNCHGRDPYWPMSTLHYASAYDLTQIARAVLADSVLAGIVATGKTGVYTSRQGFVEITNTNDFVENGSYSGIIGVKTGTTGNAGACLVSAARRSGRTIIACVLGSSDNAQRYADSRLLLDHGFACIGQ